MPTLTEHDAHHERRHRIEEVGKLISLSRVVASVLRRRADITEWDAGAALRDAADAAERAFAEAMPPSGKTRYGADRVDGEPQDGSA
jgi:hypothetical protein